ncbi:MAG TPA: SRPBCC family protein [Acidimicrobiia bacterium]|nr:SRPBCC family protein [Acidimicrobiia bacterium]
MRIEESIVINRPHEEVFAFFDQRTNDSRWMASVVESEWLEPGESTRLGRKGRMVMDAMGRREFEDVVIEYEPGRQVGHRSVSENMVVYSACHADPVPGGTRATVVTQPERLPGGPLGRLMSPFVARSIRRNVQGDLVRLKQLLETR